MEMHNTGLITPFMAREGRSYVISVCGVLRRSDIPDVIIAVLGWIGR